LGNLGLAVTRRSLHERALLQTSSRSSSKRARELGPPAAGIDDPTYREPAQSTSCRLHRPRESSIQNLETLLTRFYLHYPLAATSNGNCSIRPPSAQAIPQCPVDYVSRAKIRRLHRPQSTATTNQSRIIPTHISAAPQPQETAARCPGSLIRVRSAGSDVSQSPGSYQHGRDGYVYGPASLCRPAAVPRCISRSMAQSKTSSNHRTIPNPA